MKKNEKNAKVMVSRDKTDQIVMYLTEKRERWMFGSELDTYTIRAFGMSLERLFDLSEDQAADVIYTARKVWRNEGGTCSRQTYDAIKRAVSHAIKTKTYAIK